MDFFKKIGLYKQLNLFFVVVFGFLSLSLYLYIPSEYCKNFCSGETARGVLWPIYYGAKMLFIMFSIFVFLPVIIFKKWFLYILPISLILIIGHVITTPTDVLGMFNLGKVGTIQIDLAIFALVTVIFVVAHLIYDWWKKKNSVKK